MLLRKERLFKDHFSMIGSVSHYTANEGEQMTLKERLEKAEQVEKSIIHLLRKEYPDGVSYFEVRRIADNVANFFGSEVVKNE